MGKLSMLCAWSENAHCWITPRGLLFHTGIHLEFFPSHHIISVQTDLQITWCFKINSDKMEQFVFVFHQNVNTLGMGCWLQRPIKYVCCWTEPYRDLLVSPGRAQGLLSQPLSWDLSGVSTPSLRSPWVGTSLLASWFPGSPRITEQIKSPSRQPAEDSLGSSTDPDLPLFRTKNPIYFAAMT